MEVIKILIKDLLSQLAHMFQTCLLLFLFLLLLVQLFYFFTTSPSSPNTRSKYSGPPSSTKVTSDITAGSDDQASSSSANTSEITAGSDDQLASSSSATVNPAAPQLPSTNFKYDVFVSFRGEDSRRTITRSLVKSLKEQGVDAFFDEDDLEKGEKIGMLFEAIRNSRMFVLVISENYGNSHWCMKELQEIVNTGRTFIPVFYSVDPKDVRHQTGAFGEAFFSGDTMREGRRSISGFTKALMDVGSTSGHVLDKEDDRNQDEVIRRIVEQVQETVKKPAFIIPKYVVGINERVMKIKMLFKDHKIGAQMIGIHGMGGIGKTTVVLGVYNDVYRSFTASTVLENVREGIEKNGLCFMQERLLYGLATNDKTTIDDVEIGKSILKRRLSKKKVLIVLDDIDNIEQLKALVGETDWFGNGSKILITTRDKDVLDGHGVVDTFDINKLEEDESLKLLSHHAFDKAKPPNGFLMLCEKVLGITSGLPLAIEVYGCYLKDQPVEEWKLFLGVASGVPSSEIYKRLEISLRGLHRKEKSMFLDIACLFVGCHQEIVIELWGGHDKGIDGSLAMKKLVKRALLIVGEDNILKMHDMLRDMARDIIERDAEESVSCVPTRIWDPNVARKVIQQKKGFERVEGMNLNIEEVFPKGRSVLQSLDPMHKLRILRIEGTCSSEDDQSLRLPENLELLDWKRCSISCIPSFWDLSNIVILNLSRSSLETWSPEQMLKRLRLLDLSHCCKLKTVQNFENTPNIVKLVLNGCVQLSQMDDSIEVLKRLTILSMKDCHTIAQLPGSIGGLVMLEELWLSHCFSLKSLSDSIGGARKVKLLVMYRCTSVEALPESIGSLSNLELLDLDYTSSLQHIPESIGNLMNLKKLYMRGTAVERLPPSLASLEKLVELDVSENQRVSEVPENILGSLTNLRNLQATSLNFKVLPEDMCNLSSLEFLNLNLNKKLKSVPERLGDLRCLTELILTATSVETLPDSITLLENLQTLDLSFCKKLQSLPDSIGKLTALRTFNLDSTSELLELPSSVGELRSLTRLDLGWSGIESLPKSIGCLEKLLELNLSSCRNLSVLPCVSELKELRMVSVYGSGIKEIEEWKLPVQIIAAMRLAAERSKKFSTVFMSMCCGGDKRVNHAVSSSRLREKLRGKERLLGSTTLIASDDGEWLSRDSSSRANYINNDCNIIILIYSKPYLESEECLTELEAIVESVKNNDQLLQIVNVNDDIDDSTISTIAAKDSRWRNAVEVVRDKVNIYFDSRDFSTAEVLEESIVDQVMCKLEKIMGTPIIPLLN